MCGHLGPQPGSKRRQSRVRSPGSLYFGLLESIGEVLLVVESPSMVVFERYLDEVLRDML